MEQTNESDRLAERLPDGWLLSRDVDTGGGIELNYILNPEEGVRVVWGEDTGVAICDVELCEGASERTSPLSWYSVSARETLGGVWPGAHERAALTLIQKFEEGAA
jgi:hypothetical protein